jgi:hypothetical protein
VVEVLVVVTAAPYVKVAVPLYAVPPAVAAHDTSTVYTPLGQPAPEAKVSLNAPVVGLTMVESITMRVPLGFLIWIVA